MTRIPCPSESWDSYIAGQEAANEEACYTTALRNGHTLEEADECDDGSVGCPDCPFQVAEPHGLPEGA